MEGWIIDFQSDRGPDYTFRKVVVIVDKDEDGEEIDVHIDSCLSFEDGGYYECFIYRNI